METCCINILLRSLPANYSLVQACNGTAVVSSLLRKLSHSHACSYQRIFAGGFLLDGNSFPRSLRSTIRKESCLTIKWNPKEKKNSISLSTSNFFFFTDVERGEFFFLC